MYLKLWKYCNIWDKKILDVRLFLEDGLRGISKLSVSRLSRGYAAICRRKLRAKYTVRTRRKLTRLRFAGNFL